MWLPDRPRFCYHSKLIVPCMKQSILLLIALLIFALPTRAGDIFLKLTDIPGESTDAAHKDEIEIFSYSFGMSNAATVTGGGAGTGKAVFQNISVTKRFDKSSPAMMLYCAQGKHIQEAVITLRKTGADKPVDYLRITLNDVLVSSISSGGVAGGDVPTESVTFNYGRIKFEYYQQRIDGSFILAGTFGWDILRNVSF